MNTESKFSRWLVPAIILIVGVCFMIYGATDGEALAVFKKAAAMIFALTLVFGAYDIKAGNRLTRKTAGNEPACDRRIILNLTQFCA